MTAIRSDTRMKDKNRSPRGGLSSGPSPWGAEFWATGGLPELGSKFKVAICT